MSVKNILGIEDLLPDETIWQKIRSKWVWIYALSFVVLPFSYVIKAVVSNELSVSDVGLMYSILGFVGLLSVYNDLGLSDALQHFLPKYVIAHNLSRAKNILFFTFVFQLVSGLLLGGGLYLSADWLARSYFDASSVADIIRYFGLYFLLLNVFQSLQSFYFGIQHVRTEKMVELIRMAFVCLLVLVFWYLSLLDLQTFALSWFLGLVVASVVSASFFWYRYRFFLLSSLSDVSYTHLGRWLGYGFWSLLGANAWTLISQVDLQLILFFLGKEASGYWTNYLSITSLCIFVFVPLLSFCFPFFSELVAKRKWTQLRHVRLGILGLIVLFGVILGIMMQGWWVFFSDLIFGDKYLPTGQLLQYSAWILVTPLLGILNFQYIRSFGRVRWVTLAQFFVVCVHICVSVLLLSTTRNFFYIAIVLHASHFLFFLISEWYIQRIVHRHMA